MIEPYLIEETNQTQFQPTDMQQPPAQMMQQPPSQMAQQYAGPQMYSRETTIQQAEELPCRMIETHVTNCPICSRFYNPSNTLYVAIIIGLLIICIYLVHNTIHK